MNIFERILYFLQGEMKTPTSFGWYHCTCLITMIIIIIILYVNRKPRSEKQLKLVLGTYGLVALTTETLKQLAWSFNYDATLKVVTWDYQWYAFPFQLCTTPIIVCLICLFLKKGKLRDSLFAYLSFYTILGGISSIILPDSCFVSDILVNVHTMYLHLGGFVVSVYLLMTDRIKLNMNTFKSAIKVFLIFVFIALTLNLIIYNLGILNDETFNMFYISPYFISSLPVYDVIQENVPYIVYLLIYIISLSIGAFIIYSIVSLIKKIKKAFH